MLGRLATYFVPASSVVVTALVLLGPGTPKQAPFARVRALVQPGADVLALRVEGGRRLFGVDDIARFEDVHIEAKDGDKPLLPWSGPLGADGVADATLKASKPLEGPLDVVVRTGQTLLAEGQIPLLSFGPLNIQEQGIRGATEGALLMVVSAKRGILAAPFADDLEIRVGFAPHVSPYKEGFSDITIEAAAPGAELSSSVMRTDDKGVARLRITPLAHTVELSLSARASYGATGRWEGLLPVHAGAIWLDSTRTNDTAVLLSPAPRDRAYVSLLGDFGRVFGTMVPLAKDESGLYAGRVALPSLDGMKHAALVVSGDSMERGSGTVVFPLIPAEGRVAVPPLALALDGASAAEARERARASKARIHAVLLVVAAALAEALLIIVQARRAQRLLDKNLAQAVKAEASEGFGDAIPLADQSAILQTAHEKTPLLRLALSVALVLLGFAMIAALSTFSW